MFKRVTRNMLNAILVLFLESKFQKRSGICTHKWKVFLPLNHIFAIPGYAYTLILSLPYNHLLLCLVLANPPIVRVVVFTQRWMVQPSWEEPAKYDGYLMAFSSNSENNQFTRFFLDFKENTKMFLKMLNKA